jgi:hypothetical protein
MKALQACLFWCKFMQLILKISRIVCFFTSRMKMFYCTICPCIFKVPRTKKASIFFGSIHKGTNVGNQKRLVEVRGIRGVKLLEQ